MKMAGAVRTGGKGTMRRYVLLTRSRGLTDVLFIYVDANGKSLSFWFRKKKAVHKTATTDDKRLQSTLKRVGVNTIPAIEEVNIFKDDLVIQFLNPKGLSLTPAMLLLLHALDQNGECLVLLTCLTSSPLPMQCKLPSRQTHGWSVDLHRRKVFLVSLLHLIE